MATLLSLNEDVQRLILQKLPKESQSAMCLFHPTIRPIAEELLYSKINLAWSLKEAEVVRGSFPWPIPCHPIIPLLRTLIGRPDLTRLIRAIFCLPPKTGAGHRQSIMTFGYLKLPNPPLAEAIALVAQTSLPYRDIWLEYLEAGKVDAYLAFLLTQLPCIQQLELYYDLWIESDLLKTVLAALIFRPPLENPPLPTFAQPGTLQSLKTLKLDPYIRVKGDQDEFGAAQDTKNACHLSWFHHPGLENFWLRLDLVRVENIWSEAGIPPPPAPSTALEKLHLDGGREDHLPQILSCAPKLRSFHWLWAWYNTIDGRTRNIPYNSTTIALDPLISSLNLVKDTLTELNIHAIVSEEWSMDKLHAPLRTSGSPRGLSNLTALRKLTIPLAFLTGFEPPVDDIMVVAESLPPNLQILVIRGDLYAATTRDKNYYRGSAFVPCLVAWLTRVEDYTPRLQRLCVDNSCVYHDDWECEPTDPWYNYTEGIPEIPMLARKAGIEFFSPTCQESKWPETDWNPDLMRLRFGVTGPRALFCPNGRG